MGRSDLDVAAFGVEAERKCLVEIGRGNREFWNTLICTGSPVRLVTDGAAAAVVVTEDDELFGPLLRTAFRHDRRDLRDRWAQGPS